MSGQQPEKTRERAPANLGIKFNPALGATNTKRFDATVRALLKSNQESGELALAVLEGRANSSKESLVLFEPLLLLPLPLPSPPSSQSLVA